MSEDGKKFIIESAPIIFRNFEGKEGPMNSPGDRNFCITLTKEQADQLDRDGWNVRYLDAREEGEADIPYMQIRVSFKNRPPRIVLLTSASRTLITEDSVSMLDGIDIANADLSCRGYEWDVQGKQGVKAYLKSLFITLEEDELDRKYAVDNAGGA